MSWLPSIILGALPDLWILAALASGALWLYGWLAPGRISAEIIRLGSLVALGASVYLWTYAQATQAYDARVKAAVAAERERMAAIIDQSVTAARDEARAADEARKAAEGRLAVALESLPPDKPPPAAGHGGGLSPASGRAVIAIRGGK